MPAPPTNHGRSSPGNRRWLALTAITALAVLGTATPAPGQAKTPLVLKEGVQETSILADRLEQVSGSNDLYIAIGNVELTQGASRILADRVEVNRDTGETVAQGKVVFFDGQDRLLGDRVDYNLKTGTGVVYNGSTVAAPYYHLSGERMDRIGEGVYKVRRGTFTTCEGDEPDWSFKMDSSTVDMEEGIFGTGGAFWVRNIPLIPYVPFFAAAIRRERQSGFLYPEFGNSSRKGFYAKVPYYWAINDSQDATVSLDTFSRRGIGGELEYRYVLSETTRGVFNGFLIQEMLRDSSDRERLNIPETRGSLALKHEWRITPRLTFKIDANAVTDDLVYREYGDRLSERSRQRAETNVFLSQRWDAWAVTANVLWYQDLTNPAALELQRVPEIRLVGVRQPIPGLRSLLYEMQASFTNFYRVVGDGGVRLDWHPRVFLPIPVAGLFTVTPFAGPRLTFYNQLRVSQSTRDNVVVDDTVYDPHWRRQIEGGFEIESRASRVYPLDGWGGLGLGAVQHLIEPRGTLLAIRGYDQKANPLYDPNIDNIQRVTHFTYSLINRLNAKTLPIPGTEAVRWEAARLTLSQTFDIDRAIYQTRPFKDLQGEFILDPHRYFRFRADAAYNMYGLGLRSANVDLTGHYRDVALTTGWRYNAISGTNFVVAEASTGILHNLDAHVGTSWNVNPVNTNNSGNSGSIGLEQRIGIDWRFQCFAIAAEYVYRYHNEDEFKFSINLLGVGSVGTKVGTGQ